MNWFCSRLTAALAITLMPYASCLPVARAAESPTATASPLEAAVAREAEATIKAFNAGDAAALGAMFLDGGELVDEAGTVHAGRQAIASLFSGFFKKFPKAVLEMQPTSTRPVGDALVVEEGERRITAADGAASAQVRYVVVRSKQGDRWPIVAGVAALVAAFFVAALVAAYAEPTSSSAARILRPLSSPPTIASAFYARRNIKQATLRLCSASARLSSASRSLCISMHATPSKQATLRLCSASARLSSASRSLCIYCTPLHLSQAP
jgi:uncharacterized protein (TIGR02246 family)